MVSSVSPRVESRRFEAAKDDDAASIRSVRRPPKPGEFLTPLDPSRRLARRRRQGDPARVARAHRLSACPSVDA